MATFNSLESISPGTLVNADILGGLVLSNLWRFSDVLRAGTYCKESPTKKRTHANTDTNQTFVCFTFFH